MRAENLNLLILSVVRVVQNQSTIVKKKHLVKQPLNQKVVAKNSLKMNALLALVAANAHAVVNALQNLLPAVQSVNQQLVNGLNT